VARTAQLGDIVEIQTAKGLAYAQHVNNYMKRASDCPLMRILPGVFKTPLEDFEHLVAQEGSYCCFWQPDFSEGRVHRVANVPVPKQFRKMPMFKSRAVAVLPSGRVSEWSLWNGISRGNKAIARLTAEQKRYPLQEIVSLDFVICRIERHWRPEHACAEPPDPGFPLTKQSNLKPPKVKPAKVRSSRFRCS